MLHDPDLDDMPRVKRARYAREQKMANAYNRSLPKKITVLRNGEPTQRHILLINRRTAQTFDQILSDLSEMFQTAIRRLHTMEGRKVRDISLSLISDKFLIRVSEVGLEFFFFLFKKLHYSRTNTLLVDKFPVSARINQLSFSALYVFFAVSIIVVNVASSQSLQALQSSDNQNVLKV